MNELLRRAMRGGVFAGAAWLLAAGPAVAAITVTSVAITGGKLVVEGSSPTGTSVLIDGKYRAAISTATRRFRLSATYHPDDCVIDIVLSGAAAPAVKAVVGNCGEAGPVYLGRASFTDVPVALNTLNPVTVATFTVVPPMTGKLLLQGRGTCTVDTAAGGATRFSLYATDDAAVVDTSPAAGTVFVPENANVENQHIGWTLDKAFNVTAGVAKTILVESLVDNAAVPEAICEGTVTVQSYTKSLTLTTPP
jgi:hypothetical protein